MENKEIISRFSLPKNQNDFAELEGLFAMYALYNEQDTRPTDETVAGKICSKINEIIESCIEKADENKMRIYEFRIGDEKIWVSGRNMLEALKTENNASDMLLNDYDEIIEIPESKWDEHKVHYEFDKVTDDNKFEHSEKEITFREWMNENGRDSDIIATTVY